MAKKAMSKKLTLNKETVSNLSDKEMNIIQGGIATNGGIGCNTTSTVTVYDC